MERIPVVAYCRVSTKSTSQQNSFENQADYFRQYLNKPEYELLDIYADEGISGTKLKRKEFERMLIDAGLQIKEIINDAGDTRKNMVKYVTIPSGIRKPKFKYIFVKDTSRFSRNVKVQDIIDDLRAVGVFVRFMDFDLSTEKDDDIQRIRMFLDNAEMESRLKSKKVIFGFEMGASKNKIIHSNGKLFGYSYNQPENRLEVVESEALIIRLIFDMYQKGLGIRRIINKLSDDGIYTRQGKQFTKNAIRRILTQEKYIGLNNRLKNTSGVIFKNKTYPKVKSSYMLEPNEKIPQIVDKEVFESCQKMLNGRVDTTNMRGKYNGLSEYSGKLSCGLCGATMHSNYYFDKRGCTFDDEGNLVSGTPREYHSYICSTRKTKGISVCNNPLIKKENIDLYIEELCNGKLYNLLSDALKKEIIAVKQRILLICESLDKDNNELITKTKNDIAHLQEQYNSCLELALTAVSQKERLTTRMSEIDSEIAKKQSELLELSKSTVDKVNEINTLLEMLRETANIEIKQTYAKEEVLKQIDGLTIYPDGTILLNNVSILSRISSVWDKYAETMTYRPEISDFKVTSENIKLMYNKYADACITVGVEPRGLDYFDI